MKTIYSIRDSLGRELWWTTGRAQAIQLAADVNEIGVGGAIRAAGGFGHAYLATDAKGVSLHALPVAVWRGSPMTATTPARLLSERRAADRKVMAAKLIEAAGKAGAKSAEVLTPVFGERRIDVRIDVPGGATIRVDFDGRSSQPDVFVQTWNLDRPAYDAGVRLRDWEGRATAKRNTVVRGFDQLVSMLVADITGFLTGDGYWK